MEKMNHEPLKHIGPYSWKRNNLNPPLFQE